jgi:hypothetical protein
MTKSDNNWFDVDRKGLAQLIEKKGKVALLFELIQNSIDADGTTEVKVALIPQEGRPEVILVVEDNSPDGFHDLRHAWTLFASSSKKADPKKRGRFNLGEKLVLALCKTATIITTTGGVEFREDGRHQLRRKTVAGSNFTAVVRMTRDELAEALAGVRRLIIPKDVTLTVNGEEIPHREPIATLHEVLQTVIADEEGNLKSTHRYVDIHVYEPLPGEPPSIYELGIPVVETGDRFHLDVQQKVPVNFDRDNVPPGYLATLRAAVVNKLHDKLSKEELAAAWVTSATTSGDIKPEAVDAVLTARFGDKRVIADASDPEANKRAVAAGYAVIHGGSLPGATWKVIKEAGLALPAGQVTPGHHMTFHGDGTPLKEIEPHQWTPGMRAVVTFYDGMIQALLGRKERVTMALDPRLKHRAVWDPGGYGLILNKLRLGNGFFIEGVNVEVIRLGIHEIAHDKVGDHLSDDYHRECCRLGAVLAIKVSTYEFQIPRKLVAETTDAGDATSF